jgi:NitT/TauT family transport system substrate-binding protein
MKINRQMVAGVLFIVLMIFSQACGASQNSSEVPDLGVIRVGHLATIGSSPFYIAIDKGYFKEAGLDVQLERFDSGSKMIAPLSVGQLDVGTGEPGTALFNAISQGLDVRAVCGMAVTNKEGYASIPFVVRKDLVDSGEITQPSDLKGKKIASNVLRGMTEYSIVQILENGGLMVDDVQLVPMPFPDTAVSLANQAVDAAYLPHPFLDVTVNEGITVEMFGDDTGIGEYQNGIMYFGQRFLDPANKEIAVRFLSVYLKALRELMSEDYQNDENLAIINKYTKLDPEVVRNTLLTYQDPNCTLLPDSLEKTQAYYIGRGYTDYQELIPIEDVIDESFRIAAVSQLGEYKK